MNAAFQTAKTPTPTLTPTTHRVLQRQCACGESARAQEDDARKSLRVQGFATNDAAMETVPPIVRDVLRSSGQPLDPATRAFMEPRFGHDFGHVRVHRSATAAASARALGARAYTVGSDIVFSANAFAPASHEGRELIAHELAHTIQQRLASAPAATGEPGGVFESAARDAARSVANGGRTSRALPACGIGIARAPVPASAFDDDELARQLKEATRNLKPGEKGDWWVESLRAEVTARANRRHAGEQERLRAAAAKQAEIAREAAARKEATDRALAVAEAIAVGTRPVPDDDEPEELLVTPMALGSKAGIRASKAKTPAPRRRKPATPSKFSPGGFTNDDIYGETDAANKRIDEQIAKDREISKQPYQSRLDEVRLRLQSKSGHWYSWKEAVSRMTGDEVWREGINSNLFIESEKRAVYEDQNSLQQYVQEQMEEDRKRRRAKFESDQYRAWVAQGEQLSSPAPILQPFAFAAFGPFIAAAYGGTQAGFQGAEAYQACAHGSTAECVEATAKLGMTMALDVTAMKTGSRPQSGAGGEPGVPQDSGLTFRRGTDVTNRGPFPDPQLPSSAPPLPEETTVPPLTSKPAAADTPKTGPMRRPPGGGNRGTYTATEKTGTQHKESTPTVEVLPRSTVPIKEFEPPEPGHYIRRKPPSAETQRQILARAGRTTDGRLRDANTGRPLNEGEAVWGHAPYYQFKEMRDMAEKLGWTQEEFDRFFEDPAKWQIEYGPTNSGRTFDRVPRQRPIH
jgi:hypothetical protein